MPPGEETCFPRGCRPLSVGSVTLTTMVCLREPERKGVMSHEKGSYPPRWLMAKLSSIHTRVSQSDASMLSINCLSFHCLGISNSLEYHRASESVIRRLTPESADSTG